MTQKTDVVWLPFIWKRWFFHHLFADFPKKHNKPLYKNQVLFIESILNKSYRNCQKYIILYPKNFFDEKWFRKNSGQLIFNKTGGVGVWFENPKGKALRIPREIPFSFGDSDTNNSLLRGPPGLDCSGILAKETSSLGPLGTAVFGISFGCLRSYATIKERGKICFFFFFGR